MSRQTFEFRVTDDQREQFLQELRGVELEVAIERLVRGMVLSQEKVREEVAELDRRFPLQGHLSTHARRRRWGAR